MRRRIALTIVCLMVAAGCAHSRPRDQDCRYQITAYRMTLDSIMVPIESTLVCRPR